MNLRAMLTGGIQRLAHANRYSTYHVNREENVAEHTCFVSLYCLLIGKDLEANTKSKVDWSKLLQSALFHDLDEALTGDFLRSVKYKTPGLKELLDSAAENTIVSLEEEMDAQGYILPLWKQCKDKTVEGYILRIADFLGVASYVIGEFHSGNKHLIHVFDELGTLMKALESEISDPENLLGCDKSILIYYTAESRSLIAQVKLGLVHPKNSEYSGNG